MEDQNKFLVVFQFFVSVSEEVFNISRNSLNFLVGQCPHLNYWGHVPRLPTQSLRLCLYHCLPTSLSPCISIDLCLCTSSDRSSRHPLPTRSSSVLSLHHSIPCIDYDAKSF